tara:strand:+ start:20524 stop:20739 length:216 start_codon:yes stop_codon:yes gene_type:complete
MSNQMITNRDIKVGQATVPYDEDNADNDRVGYDEETHNPGWVLPGGEKTLNKRLATQTAERINNLIRRPCY